MLLAVVKGDFNAPSHGVPSDNLLHAGIVTRRVEYLLPSPLRGFHCDDSQRTIGSCMNTSLSIRQASFFGPPIDVERNTTTPASQHLFGCKQAFPAFARPTSLSRFRFGGVLSGCVQTRRQAAVPRLPTKEKHQTQSSEANDTDADPTDSCRNVSRAGQCTRD